MERVMHAYQTRSRSHSPASQLEAAYRASEASATIASNGTSWETLHRRNVMERARNVGNEWMKGKDRDGTSTVLWAGGGHGHPRSPISPGIRPGHPHRSVSYATGSPSQNVNHQIETGLQATRRQSGGEITMMHTRWDGTKTPITEKDHPAHYAALKEHRLVRQKSRQSLVDGHETHSEVGGSARTPDSNRAATVPPVSIERWREHLHQAGGARMPPIRSHVRSSSPAGAAVGERPRPVYRHAKTLPLPLDPVGLARSPTFTGSGDGQDETLALTGCSGSSFDVKTAYDQVKSEKGLVSFDQVLGLNDEESVG
jgi:hypothetical protein